jgi:hypothetical protein
MSGPVVSEEGVAPRELVLRALWIAARLILIVCLGERGVLFFYQLF